MDEPNAGIVPLEKIAGTLSGYRLLIVDGNAETLKRLKKGLGRHSFRLEWASDTVSAFGHLREHPPHAVLAVWRGERQQAELMREFHRLNPNGLFYFYADRRFGADASKLVAAGATNCLLEPFDLERLAAELKGELSQRAFRPTEADPVVSLLQKFMLFRSDVMKKGLSVLPRVSETDYNVLITGETGTGKELVSRAIHALSRRRENPFVAVNCGAIQETLIESELFGHEKGAFTGATSLKRGRFEAAHRGTIFLDEIGEMPMKSQVRLLRILEDGKLTRVGGERDVRVNVRVLAATRVDLENAIDEGLFREDLYYRLNILHVHMPPLRERKDDVPLLATYFLHRTLTEIDRKPPFPYFGEEALRFLCELEWTGNVRELRNLLTRIAVLLPLDVREIEPGHLQSLMLENKGKSKPVLARPTEDGVFIPYGVSIRDAENRLIRFALEKNGGNKTRTAQVLGISARNLGRKVRNGL